MSVTYQPMMRQVAVLLPAAVAVGLSGCNSMSNPSHGYGDLGSWITGSMADQEIDPRFMEVEARPPQWPVGWEPTTGQERPENLPVIHLDEKGDVVSLTITPTIIDTTTFPVQRQPNEPWTGPTARPGKLLPPHTRDKTLAPGPRLDLPLGGLRQVDRVTPAPRFPAISATVWTPPDPTLAVGPGHIVTTVNMAIAFYDKEGNEQFYANLDSTGSPGFFEEVGGGSFTFDPKCFYDHYSDRFVVLALEYYGGSDEAWITMAVSDDSDPNGTWYKYRTWAVVSIGNTDYWVDYPGLGFDDSVYTVTGNLFKLSGPGSGWGGVLFRSFDKTPMLTGDPAVYTNIRDGDAASAQCAQHHGDPVAPFFVSMQSSSSMRIQAIRDPLGSADLRTTTVAVPSFDPNPPGGSNPGGNINALDGRLMNVYWRNEQLYFAHAVGDGNQAQVRWYHVDTGDWPGASGGEPADPVLVQSGAIDLPNGQHAFFPAIASNTYSDVGLVFGHCSSNVNPSVRITGRYASDPAGTMGEPEIVVESPTGADGRWGDYFDLTVDPVDDTTFWYVGEWASSSGWQTWIGSFEISEPGCTGDATGDDLVNVEDILAVIAAWNDECQGCLADVDNSGMVDVADLLLVIANWGLVCE